MTTQEIQLIKSMLNRKVTIADQIEGHVKNHQSITDSMSNFTKPEHPWYGDVKFRATLESKLKHHERMITLLASQL